MPNDSRRPGNRHGELSDAIPPRTAELTQAIRAAHEEAGRPSYRKLNDVNRRAGRAVLSPATISRILKPDPYAKDQKSLPAWDYYEDLLLVLGQSPERFADRWQAAQDEWQARPEPAAEPASAAAKPWWRRTPVVGAAAAVVVLAAAGVVWLAVGTEDPQPAGSATGPDPSMDNVDPHAAGCTPQLDEQTYYTHLYEDFEAEKGMTKTLLTMHYSPECRSAWAVLEHAPPGTEAVLHRAIDGTELRCTADARGKCTTKQLSDRGTTTYASARTDQAYGKTRAN
jgi:hypothetical protein